MEIYLPNYCDALNSNTFGEGGRCSASVEDKTYGDNACEKREENGDVGRSFVWELSYFMVPDLGGFFFVE